MVQSTCAFGTTFSGRFLDSESSARDFDLSPGSWGILVQHPIFRSSFLGVPYWLLHRATSHERLCDFLSPVAMENGDMFGKSSNYMITFSGCCRL
jgi:hypothetical protein